MTTNLAVFRRWAAYDPYMSCMRRFWKRTCWACLTLVLVNPNRPLGYKPTVSACRLLLWQSLSLVSPKSSHRQLGSNSNAARHLGEQTAMCDSSTDTYKQCNMQCVKNIGVFEDKQTDVIIAGRRADATEHVIFFGGDVQDYPEAMMSHRDNGQYVRWNSLATAALLCQRFPSAMVMVVKPHHMHLKTFSVYSQFVQSNDFGCPTHSPDQGAWRMLRDIYKEATTLALQPAPVCYSEPAAKDTEPPGDKGYGDNGASQTEISSGSLVSGSLSCSSSSRGKTLAKQQDTLKVPIHLIGFSKGCIVLNQLVTELETVKADSTLFSFVSQVRIFTWLDGGHNGGSNTWVTNPSALKHLASLSADICVHVTPYQVKDPMRKWIGKEKRKFVEVLLKAGAKVNDNLHFDDMPRSIDNHFRVLEVF